MAGVFNTFFASVFNVDNEPRGSQYPEPEDHELNCENDQLPVNPEVVQDLLLQLNICRSLGPDGLSQRKIDNVMANLTLIFERYWESREVRADWG